MSATRAAPTLAAIYPGQGSQRVGMGRDLMTAFSDDAGPVFGTADEILGFDLSGLCFDGPVEELRRTENTQPALFVVSLVIHRILQRRLPTPAVVAGHSLGEYTALVAADVLDWRDALRLVRRRGELMAAVNDVTPGAMLAVIGVDVETVAAACEEATRSSNSVIEIANDNDEAQTVVSGTIAGARAFQQLMTSDEKAPDPRFPDLRIVRLDVGAPFHSSLMATVEAEFGHELDQVTFDDPSIPLVANVTADAVQTGTEARAALKAQLAGTVRWRESLTTMVSLGVDTFVETGPGRVLTGFCKRTYPELDVHSASDARRIERVATALSPLAA